ncbi:MAG: hypothetical protein MUE80_09100 [Acidobacteria bacterium]|nr:hypothetical protein [Acidobacteriota bacterium]
MTASPHIAIVYNAYEPRPTATGERLSEESVAEMAKQAQEAVQSLGLATTLVPLQKSLFNFLGRVRELDPDGLINLCEGYYGRPQWESNVAGIFELLGLTFTGSPAKTLAFCQDKFKAKAVLRAAGLPTAPAQLMLTGEEPLELRFPLIVKPNAEDASLGVYPDSVVRDEDALRRQVRRCLDNYKQPALVEAFIDGREFNVAVLENGAVRALPVSEIDRGPSFLPENAAGLSGPHRRRAARAAPGPGRGGLPDPGLPRLRPGRFPDGRQGTAVHPRGQSQSRHQQQRRLRPGPGRGRHRLRRFLGPDDRQRHGEEGRP